MLWSEAHLMGNLRGWGRASEYQLPLCACVCFCTWLICVHTSTQKSYLWEPAFLSSTRAYLQKLHITYIQYLQVFNTTVHVCTIVCLSANQDEAQHLNCAEGKTERGWGKRIEWVWLREMDECSDKRSCLDPDRYTQQMDDSYLGDHRVHAHA